MARSRICPGDIVYSVSLHKDRPTEIVPGFVLAVQVGSDGHQCHDGYISVLWSDSVRITRECDCALLKLPDLFPDDAER